MKLERIDWYFNHTGLSIFDLSSISICVDRRRIR